MKAVLLPGERTRQDIKGAGRQDWTAGHELCRWSASDCPMHRTEKDDWFGTATN